MPTLVELHLRSHSNSAEDKQTIEESMKRVDEVLGDSTGKVYVFLENASTSPREAANAERLVDLGVRPLLALLCNRIPAVTDIVQMLVELGTAMGPAYTNETTKLLGDDFFTTELSHLDSIFFRYLDSSRKSRLGILLEARADQTWLRSMEELEASKITRHQMVAAGDFSSALDLFKQNALTMAVDSSIRERLVSEKIARYIGEDVSAIFVMFGTSHTGIYHRLKRMGLPNVSRIFMNRDESARIYYFDPASAVIRKMMTRGLDSIGELEWYRGLIGDTKYSIIKEISNGENSDQSLIQIAYNTTKGLKSLGDIEELREKIKRSGILKALASI